MLTPRPYQVDSCEAVFDRLFVRGERSTLLVLPTGCGKTVVFGLVAKRWSEQNLPGRVLVLAHREELITQAAVELAGITGREPAIEMADNRALSAAVVLPGIDLPAVVVASVPTLCQPHRLERFAPDEFGLIVTDEAHHSPAASYRRIYDRFPAAKMLGVTATAKRADKVILGSVFESVAYSMGICDAVNDAWLVPVEQRYVVVNDMDLSQVGTVGDDLNQKQLGTVLTGDRVLDQMVAATVELCGHEPTLIFTAPRAPGESVSQGELFCESLNRIKPDRAIFLTGETETEVRRTELRRFESGDRQYLIGCGLFTEGFNSPTISRVVMARVTKSVVYYTQCIGRGTRTLRGVLTPDLDKPQVRHAAIAASAKPGLLVIDFVGNSGRHKLVSAVDIFAGNASAAIVARAKEKAKSRKPGLLPKQVGELLDEAKSELDREQKRREARKANLRINRVDLYSREVSPYEYTDGGTRQTGRATGAGGATEIQKAWLAKSGGVIRDGMTAGEAGLQIADIKKRWKEGMCSPKQERVLKRSGLADGPIPRDHAKALLDYLSATNWKANKRPVRSQLSIVRADGGFRLAVRVNGQIVPVGKPLADVALVRSVYDGLCVESHSAV